MKTFTTIRFRPKPQHFDDVVESLAKRVDFWAERTSTEKVYLVQDEDEVIFTAILAQMEILLEYQDEALNFLDSGQIFKNILMRTVIPLLELDL